MSTTPPTPPPCIYCGYDETEDITPANAPPLERLYQCPDCGRKFAVTFTPLAPRRR